MLSQLKAKIEGEGGTEAPPQEQQAVHNSLTLYLSLSRASQNYEARRSCLKTLERACRCHYESDGILFGMKGFMLTFIFFALSLQRYFRSLVSRLCPGYNCRVGGTGAFGSSCGLHWSESGEKHEWIEGTDTK